MAYRVLRTENRTTVGPWKGDLVAGQILKDLPDYVAEQLLDTGMVEECSDNAIDDPWFAQPNRDEPFGPHGPGVVPNSELLAERQSQAGDAPDHPSNPLEYSADATSFDPDRDGQNEVVPGSGPSQTVDERGDLPTGGDADDEGHTSKISEMTVEDLKAELRSARDAGDERVAPFSQMNREEAEAEVRKLRRRSK